MLDPRPATPCRSGHKHGSEGKDRSISFHLTIHSLPQCPPTRSGKMTQEAWLHFGPNVKVMLNTCSYINRCHSIFISAALTSFPHSPSFIYPSIQHFSPQLLLPINCFHFGPLCHSLFHSDIFPGFSILPVVLFYVNSFLLSIL